MRDIDDEDIAFEGATTSDNGDHATISVYHGFDEPRRSGLVELTDTSKLAQIIAVCYSFIYV